jgi:hypothetical protein
MSVDRVVKLPPTTFVHVQDTNTSVTRVVVGPARVVCLAHERVTMGPSPLVVLKPGRSHHTHSHTLTHMLSL